MIWNLTLGVSRSSPTFPTSWLAAVSSSSKADTLSSDTRSRSRTYIGKRIVGETFAPTNKALILQFPFKKKKKGSFKGHGDEAGTGVLWCTFSSRALWCSNKDLRALRTSTSLETPEGDCACLLTTVMRSERSCRDTRHSRCSNSNCAQKDRSFVLGLLFFFSPLPAPLCGKCGKAGAHPGVVPLCLQLRDLLFLLQQLLPAGVELLGEGRKLLNRNERRSHVRQAAKTPPPGG